MQNYSLKNKIVSIEEAKIRKKKQMQNLYKNLTENEENLDMLILQLGKEIERLFPDLKFRLISRIKSEKSFNDKVDNALNKCKDVKQINDIQIYDIIGLNVIVEDVPESIISSEFKKSQAYDKEFDSKITSLLNEKENKKIDIKILKKIIKHTEKDLRKLNFRIKEKNKKVEQLKKQIQQTSNEELKQFMNNIILDYEKDIELFKAQADNYRGIIEGTKSVLENNKKSLEDKNNECNYEVAKFIVSRLANFEGIQLMDLTSIDGRFKIFDKDNGYKSIHNCFEIILDEDGKKTSSRSKKTRYVCEIQGKSIKAFNQANNGIAAQYHTAPKPKPGKKLKSKNLPDIFSVETPEEKEKFLEEIRKGVPRFRVYRNVDGKPEVYKLTLRECYILYYSNQLFGNEVLGIKKETEHIQQINETDILETDAPTFYRDFEYSEK